MPAGVSGASFSVLGYPRIGKGSAHPTTFRGELKVTVGGVTASNNEGIWREDDGVLSLIAREGMAAPGLPGAVLTSIGEPSLGENDQVFFTARISGGGATSLTDSVLFAQQTDGTLAPVLREGSAVQVGLGTRTIADLHNTYAFPEDARTMNLRGEMALQAPFTDGSSCLPVTIIP